MVERTLAEVWHDWLGVVRKTKPADRPTAEAAVHRLYRLLRRAEPSLTWATSPYVIKPEQVQGRVPLIGVVEMLFLEAWHRLESPETLARPLGYSDGGFPMMENYQPVWRPARLSGVARNQPRPSWMRELINLITQFDAAQMAVWEYALTENTAQAEIGRAVQDVLHACHGMVMFTDHCLLLERPRTMHLDEIGLLHSTTTPALEWRDRKSKLYAVNGVALTPDSVQLLELVNKGDRSDHIWYRLVNMRNAAERVAVIELIGWAKFLKLSIQAVRTGPAAQRVSQDDYGELWQVVCGNQTLMLLRVIDKSPNEHGEYEVHVIPVDPRLRPLPNPRNPDGVMGRPQPLTALNAVASTFGLTGEEYAAALEDES